MKMDKQDLINFWVESSDLDFSAMESLFKNGHYIWSLFLGHLVLEKLLKAYYVKVVDDNVPKTHNLLAIAKNSNLELTEEQQDFLLEVTAFNIKARYPDYKKRFYKKATKKFTERYLKKIRELRIWLKDRINE